MLKLLLFISTILTCIPVLCFAAFVISVLLSSLAATLFAAVVVSLATTTFMAFVALLFLLPTIFFSIVGAFAVHLFVIIAYYTFVYLQDHGAAPSDAAIESQFNAWSGGRFSWSAVNARGNMESKGRPRVKAQDSAVGLQSQSARSLEDIDENIGPDEDILPSERRDTRDVLPDSPTLGPLTHPSPSSCSTSSSVSTVRGPFSTVDTLSVRSLPKIIKSPRNPQISKDSRSPTISNSPKSPKSGASSTKKDVTGVSSTKKDVTGAHQPITFAKLRREHPDGLRIDSKGLFKVDDIASNSSKEDEKERQVMSGNAFASIRNRSNTAVHNPATTDHDAREAIHLSKNADVNKLRIDTTVVIVDDRIDFNDITTEESS